MNTTTIIPSTFRAALLCAAVVALISTARAQDIEHLDSAQAFAADGEISLSATSYSTTAAADRRRPLSWTVEGNLTPTVYDVALPIGFLVSAEETEVRQPFNEFGIAPHWRWLTARLGYASMNFSPYTLAGNRFLGAGVEATPGSLRFAALYGRFQRATEADSAVPNSYPAYLRTGAGAKLGFGDEAGWIDASWLHLVDDTASLVQRGEIARVAPAENTVFGVVGGVAIAEEIRFDGEFAASIYTRDLLAAPLAADSNDIPEFLGDIQPLRSSSTLALAGRASLAVRFDPVEVKLGYERVEPDYTSLGAGPIAGDLETWSVAPAVTLDSGRLHLEGSVGLQRDNLLGTKLSTSQRVVGAFGLSWNPTERFGVDARYNGYTVAQRPGGSPAVDTLASRTVTGDFSLAPRLLLGNEELQHSLVGVAALQQYTDRRVVDGRETSTSARTVALNYGAAWSESGLALGAGLTWTGAETGAITTNGFGLSANGSLPLFDDALVLEGSLGWNRSTATDTLLGELDAATVTLTQTLGAQWRVSERAGTLSLHLSAMQNSGPDSFDELTATLGYLYTFSFIP